jgi:Protein of unknown function (DUF3592)
MIPKTAKDWNRFSKWMMVLSTISMLIGVVFAIHSFCFLRYAVPTIGTIVKQIERNDSEGGTLYAPVFTFQDYTGKTHKVVSSTASYPPLGAVGEKIRIVYDPNNANHAKINSFFNLWGVALMLVGCGVFYFLCFWIVTVITKKRMARNVAKLGGR